LGGRKKAPAGRGKDRSKGRTGPVESEKVQAKKRKDGAPEAHRSTVRTREIVRKRGPKKFGIGEKRVALLEKKSPSLN